VGFFCRFSRSLRLNLNKYQSVFLSGKPTKGDTSMSFPSANEPEEGLDAAEISKIAAKEAARATKRALGEPDYDDDDDWDEEDDDEPVREVKSVEQLKRELENSQDFDIFTDVGEELAKSGLTVKYRIYRGGKMLTEEEHPYSWLKLQKDRGAGHYTVKAIDPRNNRFIKQQTQTVDNAPTDKQPTPANQGPSFQEIVGLMQEQNEQFKAELKESQKEKDTLLMSLLANNRNDNSTEYLKLISNKSDESMKMLLAALTAMKPQDNSSEMTKILVQLQQNNQVVQSENQKMMLSMVEKLQTNTTTMIEKMNDKFERSLERLSMSLSREPEKPEFDAFRVMQLTSEAEERGEKRMREMFDLVDAKAHEKADFMSSKEPQSTLDKVLSGVLPALAPAIMGAKNPASHQATAPQRGAVSPGQRKALPNNEGRGNANQGTTQNATRGRKTSANGGSNGQGARKAPKKAPSVLDAIHESNQVVETKSVDSSDNSAKIEANEVNVQNRDYILQTAVPLLLTAIQSGETLDDTVVKVYETLVNPTEPEAVAVDPVSIERDVTPDVIEFLINEYGLADDMANLLREFYVRLIKYAAWKVGQSTQAQEAVVS